MSELTAVDAVTGLIRTECETGLQFYGEGDLHILDTLSGLSPGRPDSSCVHERGLPTAEISLTLDIRFEKRAFQGALRGTVIQPDALCLDDDGSN